MNIIKNHETAPSRDYYDLIMTKEIGIKTEKLYKEHEGYL